MPKLVTVKQQEGQGAKATAYVKAYILFPAGILGLVSMVGGVGGLGYQLIATDTYTWETFLQSSGLLMLGGVLGWLQTTYHRWILRHRPEVFAARMRQPTIKKGGRPKRDGGSNPGFPQRLAVGSCRLHGRPRIASVWIHGRRGLWRGVSGRCVFLPWAGFFWAKLFFWRTVLKN